MRYVVKPIYWKERKEREEKPSRIAYGVVVDPDALKADEGETIADLKHTAHYFLSHYQQIGTPEGCAIVESYIVPVENAKIGSIAVKKDSWIVAFGITDPELWRQLKSAQFGGIEITLTIPENK